MMLYNQTHPKTITAKLDNDLEWLENHLGDVLGGRTKFFPHTVEMTKVAIDRGIEQLAEVTGHA